MDKKERHEIEEIIEEKLRIIKSIQDHEERIKDLEKIKNNLFSILKWFLISVVLTGITWAIVQTYLLPFLPK